MPTTPRGPGAGAGPASGPTGSPSRSSEKEIGMDSVDALYADGPAHPDADVGDAVGDPDLTRGELLDLLDEVFTTPPEDGEVCHYCAAEVGKPHEDHCVWWRIAQALGEGEDPAVVLVGGDTEGAERRLCDPDLDAEEVLFPQPIDGDGDPAALVLEVAHAELATGALNPATQEQIRAIARIVDQFDDDGEDLVGVPVPDDSDEET